MSKQEIVIGAIIGMALFPFIGILCLTTIPLCAIMYVLGGYEGWHKNWRRLGVPTVLCIALVLATKTWSVTPYLLAFWLTMWGSLTVGYGMNSPIRSAVVRWGVPMHMIEFVTRLVVSNIIGATLLTLVLINPIGVLIGWFIIVWGYMAAFENIK